MFASTTGYQLWDTLGRLRSASGASNIRGGGVRGMAKVTVTGFVSALTVLLHPTVWVRSADHAISGERPGLCI